MTEERINEMKELLTANGYSHDEIIRFCRYISEQSERCNQQDIAKGIKDDIVNDKQSPIKLKIKDILNRCSLPKIVVGRKYLEEAISIVHENPTSLENLESLYCNICDVCGSKESDEVKREIGYAIHIIKMEMETNHEIKSEFFGKRNIHFMSYDKIIKCLVAHI